jgi:hypothetical protein
MAAAPSREVISSVPSFFSTLSNLDLFFLGLWLGILAFFLLLNINERRLKNGKSC